MNPKILQALRELEDAIYTSTTGEGSIPLRGLTTLHGFLRYLEGEMTEQEAEEHFADWWECVKRAPE